MVVHAAISQYDALASLIPSPEAAAPLEMNAAQPSVDTARGDAIEFTG